MDYWVSCWETVHGLSYLAMQSPRSKRVDYRISSFAEFTPLAATATVAQQSAWDRNAKITKHVRESYDALKKR